MIKSVIDDHHLRGRCTLAANRALGITDKNTEIHRLPYELMNTSVELAKELIVESLAFYIPKGIYDPCADKGNNLIAATELGFKASGSDYNDSEHPYVIKEDLWVLDVDLTGQTVITILRWGTETGAEIPSYFEQVARLNPEVIINTMTPREITQDMFGYELVKRIQINPLKYVVLDGGIIDRNKPYYACFWQKNSS